MEDTQPLDVGGVDPARPAVNDGDLSCSGLTRVDRQSAARAPAGRANREVVTTVAIEVPDGERRSEAVTHFRGRVELGRLELFVRVVRGGARAVNDVDAAPV